MPSRTTVLHRWYRICRNPRRKEAETSRQIDGEAFEIAKCAMSQCTLVGGTHDDPGRLVCLESLLPAGCAQAPAIARFEAGKTESGQRRRKIIAARFGEFEKRGSHDGADRVTTHIFWSGIAATVPVKTRHRFYRTDFKRLAKDVAGCAPRTLATTSVVSQHRVPQSSSSGQTKPDQDHPRACRQRF